MVQLAAARCPAQGGTQKGVRLKSTTFFKLRPDPDEIANPLNQSGRDDRELVSVERLA